MNRRSHQLVARIARISTFAVLMVCLLSSFLAISTAFAQSGMDCCAGKAVGHCHARLKVRKPPPEPMCGAKASVENDARGEDSTGAETTSRIRVTVSRSCDRECSGCATSQTKQQKRFGTGGAVELSNSALANRVKQAHFGRSLSSDHTVEPFSPRGPPVVL